MPSRPFVPVVMDCLSLCPVASPVVRLFLLDVHSFRRTLKIIMPRAGGESNKLGNRYEGWWTVHNLIDVLSNVVVALPPEAYIEAVGVEFAKTLRDNSGEFHPVKRQHAGSGWTLYQLASMDERGRLAEAGKPHQARRLFYWHLACFGWRVEFNLTHQLPSWPVKR